MSESKWPESWVFWPHDPPEDAVVLVRVTGTETIERTRNVMREWGGPCVEGGSRKDDVTFLVPKDRRAEAEAFVRPRTS